MLTNQHKLILAAGRSHPALADAVATHLKVSLADLSSYAFASGELFVRFEESVRGADVFVLQAHCPPVNDWLMEQLLMVDALKRASAGRITVVAPFYPYARQDKKDGGREPIAASLVAEMFKAAGADRVMSVDLHTSQTQGFFDGPVDHLFAMPVLTNYIASRIDATSSVVVAPDAGRVKMAEKWSDCLGTPMAIIHKRRDANIPNEAKVLSVVGDVAGKTCIVIDDMIDTGGTIVKAAEALLAEGAKDVIVAATHGVFSEPAAERLGGCAAIREVVVTDTLPMPNSTNLDKLTVLTIAPLLGDAIKAVFDDTSVSLLPQH